MHIADVHLGVRPRCHVQLDFLELQIARLEQLCVTAAEQGATTIVSAGDLFDTNRVSTALSQRVAELLRAHQELSFVLLPGGGRRTTEATGHDAYTADSVYRRAEISSLARADNVHLLTPEQPTAVVDGTAFYGGFFAMPGVALRDDAVRHVAVVHAGVGAFGELTEEQLEGSGYSYIALGHYHRFRQLEFGGGRVAAYAGALLPFEFTATGEPGSYLTVQLTDEATVVRRSVLVDVPRFIRVAIHGTDEWQAILQQIGAHDSVEVAAYPEELHQDIAAACDADPRLRIAAQPVLYAAADRIVSDALDAAHAAVDAQGAHSPEALAAGRELILTLLRTRSGKDLPTRVVDDLRALADD